MQYWKLAFITALIHTFLSIHLQLHSLNEWEESGWTVQFNNITVLFIFSFHTSLLFFTSGNLSLCNIMKMQSLNVHYHCRKHCTETPKCPWPLTSVINWHVTWSGWKGVGWIRGRKREVRQQTEGGEKENISNMTKTEQTQVQQSEDTTIWVQLNTLSTKADTVSSRRSI